MNYAARPVTDAIVANLVAAGLIVGRGEKPVPDVPTSAPIAGWTGVAGQSPFIGYVVMHPLSGGEVDGTILEPDTDVSPLFQLSCHGATQDQCQLIADKVHTVMTTTTFTIPNRSVMRVVVDDLPGARRYDDVQPPEWMSAGRYMLLTTPN